MSVAKPDRKKSKTEFDRVYYAILADSLQITKNGFGASKKKPTREDILREAFENNSEYTNILLTF